MHKNLMVILVFLFLFIKCSDNSSKSGDVKEITIGALIPLSGEYQNQGDEILAALNFAVADINEKFDKENKDVKINLEYLDTETKATTANIQLQKLLTNNVRIIIGPLTSVEINGVKSAIDTSNSIIISPSSTLVSLAVEDNIYRIVSDDSKMIEATVDVMWNEGIRNLALFNVENEWGNSFTSKLQEKFESKGGTFLGATSHIGARVSELREYLADLSEMVKNTDDLSSTAVQMISLDVGALLLDLAAEDTNLEKVKWYGCDGFVNSNELFQFENGAQFATEVAFKSPIYGYEETSETQELMTRIENQTGSSPSAYSLLTYDALILAAEVLAEVGENSTLSKIKNELSSISSSYDGLTGSMKLNDAGDRDNGVYHFWQVIKENDEYLWKKVKTYNNGLIE